MNDIPDPNHDFLESLLAGPLPAAENHLRQSLRQQTSTMLRRRKYRRWLTQAGALAACYVAGMFTLWLWMPGHGPTSSATDVVVVQETATIPIAEHSETQVSPVVLERLGAVANKDQKAELLRQAGERYVEERGDWRSAVHCFAQSIDAAPLEERSISPSDNWLVMALKEARQKQQ